MHFSFITPAYQPSQLTQLLCPSFFYQPRNGLTSWMGSHTVHRRSVRVTFCFQENTKSAIAANYWSAGKAVGLSCDAQEFYLIKLPTYFVSY